MLLDIYTKTWDLAEVIEEGTNRIAVLDTTLGEVPYPYQIGEVPVSVVLQLYKGGILCPEQIQIRAIAPKTKINGHIIWPNKSGEDLGSILESLATL